MKYQKVCKLMIFCIAMLQLGVLTAAAPHPRVGGEDRARDRRAEENRRMDDIMAHFGVRHQFNEDPDMVLWGNMDTPMPSIYCQARGEGGHTDMRWFRRLLEANDRPLALMLLGNALKHGFHVNVRDPKTGWTPLTLSLDFGRVREAEMLMRAGADINKRGRDGRLPIQFALQFGDAYGALAEHLLEHGAIVPPLLANNPTIQLIKRAKRADEKETVERAMRRKDHAEVMRLIRQHNIDIVNEDTNLGGSFLELAIAIGDIHLMTTFVGMGVGVNSRGPNGRTPLLSSIVFGKHDMAKHLVEVLHADVNIANDKGDTPLTAARQRIIPNKTEIIDLLLAHGAHE